MTNNNAHKIKVAWDQSALEYIEDSIRMSYDRMSKQSYTVIMGKEL